MGATRRLKSVVLTVVILGAFASLTHAELQGWRTPEGGLYYGAEPPPGSVRVDKARPTAPTRVPTLFAEPKPSPTAKPTSTAKPIAASTPITPPTPPPTA